MAKQRTREEVASMPFSWSYSALKNYETCPNRHLHVDLLRDIAEPESESLEWGNVLHAAMASAIGTDDNDSRSWRDKIVKKPLSGALTAYQPWVTRFEALRESGKSVFTELGLAMTSGFQPCAWFAPDAWYRAKIDVSLVDGGTNAIAFDWKTGKRLHDSPQLMLTAILMFVHYPALQNVGAVFVWLKDMDPADPFKCVDKEVFRREDMATMWTGIAPRVALLKAARHEMNYPPKPGYLCRRWCPVTTCEHHGK